MTAFLRTLRVAMIDLRGDLRRFGVLLACLALGVGTIAAVGSVGAELQAAITRDAKVILGGDIEVRQADREVLPGEREVLESLGRVTEVIEFNARATSGERSAFLSVRAADANYPLLGAVDIAPGPEPHPPLPELLAVREGVPGAIVDAAVLDRLGIEVGDRFGIGLREVEARAILKALPDQAAQGFQLGLPVLVSAETARGTGALQMGALTRFRYKIRLADTAFEEAKTRIETAFPDAGWQIRSPQDATSTLARFFDLFSRFLVLVGLSCLLVGGVGVSNAVSAYVTERQTTIATMRSMGATSTRILVHFLTQILVMSTSGIVLGLILGAASTALLLPLLGGLLAIALQPAIHPEALLVAAGFGLLVAFVFALLPLRRAQMLRPALLFRASGGAVDTEAKWKDLLSPRFLIPMVIAVGCLAGLAVFDTRRPYLVLWYGLGAVSAFTILRAAGWLLQRLLRLLPAPPILELRHALSSIIRPKAPAPTVILSLGLGLSLLVMIVLTDSNLRGQIEGQLAEEAPSFVLLNLTREQSEALQRFTQVNPHVEDLTSTPVLSATITSVKGVPAGELKDLPEGIRGLFEGEISTSWSREVPVGSTVVEGNWWPPDYSGDPLVSVATDLRDGLGLKLGDTLELAIAGRQVVAEIASFRDIDPRGNGFSFRTMLSPGLIEAAPARYTTTISARPGEEVPLERALAQAFPDLTIVPVGEALDRAAKIIASLANAVGMIGGLAVVSGVLVLAGAMSVGRRQRDNDAMVMKILGATRGSVIGAFVLEYALLGALAAILGLALGCVGAYGIVTFVLELPFTLDLALAGLIVAGTMAVCVLTGVATTWSSLSVKPARRLRDALA